MHIHVSVYVYLCVQNPVSKGLQLTMRSQRISASFDLFGLSHLSRIVNSRGHMEHG